MVKILQIFFTFLVLFVAFYLLLTAPTWAAKIKYKVRGVAKDNQQYLAPKIQGGSYYFPSDLPDNYLYIPKINVKAPVDWNVAVDEQALNNGLKNGLVHFENSALPGENGNVFISGHSSYYWWNKSDYNRVFALLGELEAGDAIYLKYQGKPYVYQVADKNVVSPKDVSVLDASQQPILSLMTCVPVGTTKDRLVVRAKQIYPVEAGTRVEKIKIQIKEIPAVR